MQIKTRDFENLLSIVKAAASNTLNTLEDIGNCVIITDNYIFCDNGRIRIAINFESDINCILAMEKLLKLIQSISEENTTLILKDNQVIVKAGKTRVKIKTTSGEKTVIDYKGFKWNKLPTNFIDALQFCLISASKDMSKEDLLCLNIQKDKIYSCDNYRATEYKLKTKIKDQFLLPFYLAQEIVKFNITHYLLEDGLVHFKSDNDVYFTCRLYGYEYPNISPFFDVKGEIITFPDDIKETLKRLEIFSSAQFDADREVEFIISNKILICKSKDNFGEIEEQIDIDYNSDKDIKFKVHPIFFSQIIKHLLTAVIGERSVLFENELMRHIVILID